MHAMIALAFSRRSLMLTAAGSAFASATAALAAETASGPLPPISRVTLERCPVAGTDLEMRLDLVTLQPGVAAPAHHHRVAGLNFIIEGTAESAYGDEPPRLYRTGDSLQDRAAVTHTIFRNADDKSLLRFLIFYTIKPGEPYAVFH
jgi:quercetin dioxygenase-like cupin family protein